MKNVMALNVGKSDQSYLNYSDHEAYKSCNFNWWVSCCVDRDLRCVSCVRNDIRLDIWVFIDAFTDHNGNNSESSCRTDKLKLIHEKLLILSVLPTHWVVPRCAKDDVHQNREESHINSNNGREISKQSVSHSLWDVHDRNGASTNDVTNEIIFLVSMKPSKDWKCPEQTRFNCFDRASLIPRHQD